ncbi:MAG: signal peptidase II [Deltaproteobacteria bacterium]|jgi:signal peptidase II|nr:signal peptidase II [Deltaproteobacteria bacterium]MBW2534839.1 signal peptidase II [Deltaproteobacteria bacterium]
MVALTVRFKLFVLASLLVLLVSCDHGTKHWAETSLKQADKVELVSGVLDLRHTANRDTAFSLSRSVLPTPVKRPVLLVLGTIGIVAIASMWHRRRRARWTEQAAYVMLLAGAIGNVADRVVRGYVVDFIHLHHWPVFNVADVLLVAGMVLLVPAMVRTTAPARSD